MKSARIRPVRPAVAAVAALAAFALPAFVSVRPASAQAGGDPDQKRMAELLRAGTPPAGADKTFMEKHIATCLTELWEVTDTPESSGAAAAQAIRERMIPVNPDGAILERIAAALQEKALPFLDKPAKHPAAYVQLAAVFGGLKAETLVPSYLKVGALPPAGGPDCPGARLWAFRGLQGLKATVAGAGGAKIRSFLLDRLKVEDSGPVVAEIFGVMDLENKADAVKLVTAGLKIRNDLYQAGDLDGIGGESRALAILESAVGGIDEKLTVEAVEQVARLLHLSGSRYSQFDAELVEILSVRRKNPAQMRFGVCENVIASERVLYKLLGENTPTPTTLEKAFAGLVLKDPVENPVASGRPGDAVEFLTALESRRGSVEKFLTTKLRTPTKIADPADWKEAVKKADAKKPAK